MYNFDRWYKKKCITIQAYTNKDFIHISKHDSNTACKKIINIIKANCNKSFGLKSCLYIAVDFM